MICVLILCAGYSTIDQQECLSISVTNTHMLGRQAIQIQHSSASKTCTIDVSPNVGSIHVNDLPNNGAVDFEINSPSKLKVGQETT
jgi:hypothetical protein